MDGEEILIYASIASIVVQAFVAVLIWATRKGREDGVRASDIAALDKAIHRLASVVDGMPTKSALENLEMKLRLVISQAESQLTKNAADLAASLAVTTTTLATTLATKLEATATAAAAAASAAAAAAAAREGPGR